jgi:hypothetical protein
MSYCVVCSVGELMSYCVVCSVGGLMSYCVVCSVGGSCRIVLFGPLTTLTHIYMTTHYTNAHIHDH